jgi:hypothetical protein
VVKGLPRCLAAHDHAVLVKAVCLVAKLFDQHVVLHRLPQHCLLLRVLDGHLVDQLLILHHVQLICQLRHL